MSILNKERKNHLTGLCEKCGIDTLIKVPIPSISEIIKSRGNYDEAFIRDRLEVISSVRMEELNRIQAEAEERGLAVHRMLQLAAKDIKLQAQEIKLQAQETKLQAQERMLQAH